MRRVRKLRYVVGVTLAALAAMLVLFASGDSVTNASTFGPSHSAEVADTTSKAVSDVTINSLFPSGDTHVNGALNFTFLPPEWDVTGGAAIPDGSIVAIANSFANLGAFNAFCGIAGVPVAGLPLIDASTDTTNTVVFEDTDSDGVGEVFDDPNTGTLPIPNSVLFIREGVVKYPDHLAKMFPAPIPDPLKRYWGYLDIAGNNIAINYVLWSPGDFISRGIPADKGFITMLFLNRVSDPNDPGNPLSALTDFCTSFTASVTLLGTTNTVGGNFFPNPFAPSAPVVNFQNPSARPGGYDFRDLFVSQRDADDDGIENGLDTCPFTVNTDSSPRLPGAPAPVPPANLLIAAGPPPVPSTQDPDGWIDLAIILPAFLNAPGSNPFTGAPGGFVADISAPEGIDSSCDAGPSSPCGPTPFDDFLAQDCDVDGYLNRLDNCPQTPNGLVGGMIVASTQLDNEGAIGSFAPDLGPQNDGIGNACDSAPTVPDGHYHVSGSGAICTTTPDTCGPAVASPPASLAALIPASPGGPITLPDDIFSTHNVSIGKHGVKTTVIGGAKNVDAGGTETYEVSVSNFDENRTQDIVIQLSGTVNCAGGSIDIEGSGTGPVERTLTVDADGSVVLAGDATFDVDFGTCDNASLQKPDYTLTADACHAGDPAGKGFGVTPCPGGDDGHSTEDPNQADDAPIDKDIDEK